MFDVMVRPTTCDVCDENENPKQDLNIFFVDLNEKHILTEL